LCLKRFGTVLSDPDDSIVSTREEGLLTLTSSIALTALAAVAAAIALLLVVVTVWLVSQHQTLRRSLASERAEREELEAEVAQLRPFRTVADADAEATRLRREAAVEAERVLSEVEADALRSRKEAANKLELANAEAKRHRTEAQAYSRLKREQADQLLSAASTNAAKIVELAREKAEEVAGDALKAMENAEQWQASARAMRNVVEGYGDAYLKPPHGVIDDLADDYSHEEAGRQLKLARERSKLMLREGRASACDYVEKRRRETAVRFVADAFNGKVESILSRSRTSNVGTLEQKIRDAYAMVNHNGAAFRDARITPEYLDARLEELKWTTAALLLREQERDEQREIKARLREERRAQREFERAKKQAEKDESTLRKAMEKAHAKLAKARDEDRERFEAQLAELQEKLSEAEARNQRAVSMAQLTRSGFVYIISNIGSFGENVLKIGLTRRLEPLDRVRELGDASVPFKFDVHALIYAEDAPRLETALHHRFALSQVNKVNPRKEFFRVPVADVRAVVEELGMDVHWTMTSDALEYRESQALNASLATDEGLREAWLARQARWEIYLESLGDEEDEVELEVQGMMGLPPGEAVDA